MQSEAFLSRCGLPFFSVDDDVTLQLGMVSYEGIVIVGDTWQHVEPQRADKLRYGYDSSKFRISPSKRIGVACARNMDIANLVAEEIFKRLDGPCEDRRQELLEIGKLVATGFDAECQIIFADPEPSLYALLCGAKDNQRRCERVRTGWPSGDAGNPAYYWIMRYYSGALSIQQLARLGALTVISAAKFNSGIIGGLEVISCSQGKIDEWTSDKIEPLAAAVNKVAEQIGDMILK